MQSNTFMKMALIVSILCISLISCNHNPTVDATARPINHIVLVWFKAGTSQTEIDEVIQETNKLKQHIPQIKSLSLGKAISSDRNIVDDSFDLGIRLEFANQVDMQSYLTHPRHVAFVKTFLNPKLDKLLVYDF